MSITLLGNPASGSSTVNNSKLSKKSKSRSKSKDKSNLSMEAMAVKDGQKVKLLKHQLPGNSLLSEAEERKLGARKDRYGVFNADTHDFDRVVEIQREKQAERDKKTAKGAKKGSSREDSGTRTKYSSLSQKKGKEALEKQVQALADRANMKLMQQDDDLELSDDSLKRDGQESDGLPSEDSCDKVPVKEAKFDPQPIREKILDKVDSAKKTKIDERNLPGVHNLKSHF